MIMTMLPLDPFLERIRDAVAATSRVKSNREEAGVLVHKTLGDLTERACCAYKAMLNCEVEGLDGAMSVADAAIARLERAVAAAIESQSVQEVMES